VFPTTGGGEQASSSSKQEDVAHGRSYIPLRHGETTHGDGGCCCSSSRAARRSPSSSRPRSPATLTFKTARLANLSFEGLTLDTVWQLDNPNAIGISLARADYQLTVEASRWWRGLLRRASRFPRRAAPSSPSPQHQARRHLSARRDLATKDYAKYRVAGTVASTLRLGVLDFPLAYEGQFEVPKVPKVDLERAGHAPAVRPASSHRSRFEAMTRAGRWPGRDARLQVDLRHLRTSNWPSYASGKSSTPSGVVDADGPASGTSA